MRPEGSWPTVEAEHLTAALKGQWGGPTPTAPGLTWGSPEGFNAEAAPVPQLPKRRRAPGQCAAGGRRSSCQPRDTGGRCATRGWDRFMCSRLLNRYFDQWMHYKLSL